MEARGVQHRRVGILHATRMSSLEELRWRLAKVVNLRNHTRALCRIADRIDIHSAFVREMIEHIQKKKKKREKQKKEEEGAKSKKQEDTTEERRRN